MEMVFILIWTSRGLERIVVDNEMMDRAKATFMERLEKRRVDELPIKEEQKVLVKVIDFLGYKK